MVSHLHKCIFVHIPKAAGTSIEQAFMEKLNMDMDNRHALLLGKSTNKNVGPRRVSHLTASEYVNLHFVSQEIFDAYFKFAIVRNPIDRLYSTYKYRRYVDYLSFDDYIKLKLEDYINSKTEGYFYVSQYNYLYNGDKLLVDFVGKLETLERDFIAIQNKLNLNLQLKHSNKSNEVQGILGKVKVYGKLLKDSQAWGRLSKKEHNKDLSLQAIEIIKKYYEKDFETFNYLMPNPKL